MGPPGCARREIAVTIAEFQARWVYISVGDLLRAQIEEGTQYSDRIDKSFAAFTYVDDDIVIELVKRAIDDAEHDKNSWIVEGFPRTLAQVMVL
jgi:adenylate kinase